jgi:hypothetical protein
VVTSLTNPDNRNAAPFAQLRHHEGQESDNGCTKEGSIASLQGSAVRFPPEPRMQDRHCNGSESREASRRRPGTIMDRGNARVDCCPIFLKQMTKAALPNDQGSRPRRRHRDTSLASGTGSFHLFDRPNAWSRFREALRLSPTNESNAETRRRAARACVKMCVSAYADVGCLRPLQTQILPPFSFTWKRIIDTVLGHAGTSFCSVYREHKGALQLSR